MVKEKQIRHLKLNLEIGKCNTELKTHSKLNEACYKGVLKQVTIFISQNHQAYNLLLSNRCFFFISS